MKSIFNHKQYDGFGVDGSSYIRTVTCFSKEINDLEWKVEPLENENLKFLHRQLNLNLLENKIDSKNYEYVHYGESARYRYFDGFLYLTSPNLDEYTQMEMNFDEACEYIKKEHG